jgi:hypothetical protein
MVDSVKSLSYLSLSEAQASGRLGDFVVQEEARGIGPALAPALSDAISRVIRERLEGRTSRSASFDDLTGKRTR